jgi:hypothetical protein
MPLGGEPSLFAVGRAVNPSFRIHPEARQGLLTKKKSACYEIVAPRSLRLGCPRPGLYRLFDTSVDVTSANWRVCVACGGGPDRGE